MTTCPLCGLPESEHHYDCAAWGYRYFDGTEGHPRRPAELSMAPLYWAVAFVAALLIFAFYFGDDIDRAIILFGLLVFAPAMAGGLPEAEMATAQEEMDG